jgi:hypothetical protein
LPNGISSRKGYIRVLVVGKGKLISPGGRLILVNLILTNIILHMISFFLVPKESCTNQIITILDSFGKGTTRKRNIDWLKRVSVVPKIRVGLVFTTLRSKIQPYWVNGYSIYLLRMRLGKSFKKRKYFGRKALSQVPWKPGDSHFWVGLRATNK